VSSVVNSICAFFAQLSSGSWRLGGSLFQIVFEAYHMTKTLKRIAIIVGMSKEKVAGVMSAGGTKRLSRFIEEAGPQGHQGTKVIVERKCAKTSFLVSL
jgi:hypothetical protein